MTHSYSHQRIIFHSFPLAAVSVLGRLLADDQSFLLVNIGGELTEVTVVWRGQLRGNVSYPYGRNSLIRSLATKLLTTPEEAAGSLRLSIEGGQHPAAADRLGVALVASRNEWLELFGRALDGVLDGCLMPRDVFLVGDRQLNSLFRDWLAAGDYGRVALSDEPLIVSLLSEDLLNRFCESEAHQVRRDLPLVIEALFCATMLTAR